MYYVCSNKKSLNLGIFNFQNERFMRRRHEIVNSPRLVALRAAEGCSEGYFRQIVLPFQRSPWKMYSALIVLFDERQKPQDHRLYHFDRVSWRMGLLLLGPFHFRSRLEFVLLWSVFQALEGEQEALK
jgi:hypothetical protein